MIAMPVARRTWPGWSVAQAAGAVALVALVASSSEGRGTDAGMEAGSSSVSSSPFGTRREAHYAHPVAARARLAALKASRFSPAGRPARVQRALAALAASSPGFDLDRQTWKWIAEDVDLESF
jgi:hypothetical protein